MPRPYNYDLRKKAVEAILNGATIMEVSQFLNVSYRTVQRWLRQWSETGDVRPKEGYQKGHSHKLKDLEEFQQFVDANPGLTQREIAAHFGVSRATIWKALQKIGYTLRKKRTSITSKTAKSGKLIAS
ncbi:MAG: helix-turn-helix domain-containing protein [Gloeomargarita sp. SKYBB_i_bin120]|nr:helix-turn-helix domain-containing protein [Gloeomargarita sp. SKYG98]MCS7291861.1 helix-turn-helix domain-containing protein [Gloeomargarita sp. SKYB120]MDW8177421.1 helix-turn-helix domain-containing protein [Gloeomargarita sp. SKYBB_i_bin120]